MIRMLLIFISVLLITSGCAQKRIIDDLALLNAISYDLTDDENEPIKVTATFPIISKDGKYDRDTITVTSKSIKGARAELKNETSLQIEIGQLRVSLFGRKLAEKGLFQYMDTFVRDPNIGPRVMLALGQAEASDMITLKINSEGQNATYLERFISKIHTESKRSYFNIYQFFRDYHDDGIDPILPVFMVESGDLKFDGIGLFLDDKLVKLINPKEARMLFFFREEMKQGEYDTTVKWEDGREEEVMLSYIQTKHKIKVDSTKRNNISATIKIELLGDVQEYTGTDDLSDPKVQMKLEKLISKQINKQGEDFISLLKENKVDPIGIGKHVRNKMRYRDWQELNWHDAIQNADISIETTVKFSSGGKWK
jgi:spore germination protein